MERAPKRPSSATHCGLPKTWREKRIRGRPDHQFLSASVRQEDLLPHGSVRLKRAAKRAIYSDTLWSAMNLASGTHPWPTRTTNLSLPAVFRKTFFFMGRSN